MLWLSSMGCCTCMYKHMCSACLLTDPCGHQVHHPHQVLQHHPMELPPVQCTCALCAGIHACWLPAKLVPSPTAPTVLTARETACMRLHRMLFDAAVGLLTLFNSYGRLPCVVTDRPAPGVGAVLHAAVRGSMIADLTWSLPVSPSGLRNHSFLTFLTS